jgi:hypothetical protein
MDEGVLEQKTRRLLSVTKLTQNLYVVILAMKCSGNIR